ncbi:MAG: DUF2061 domain-containing protein [Bacteroidia bacterium]|nr:DUF2061 domain-containing protein [Bacteroidia bacterium]
MKDTYTRSIAKTISWRFFATLTTFVIAVGVFHEDPDVFGKASATAGIELTLKLVFYYFHERAWIKVKWGKVPDEEKSN